MKRDNSIDKIRLLAILFIIIHHCTVNDIGLQPYLRFGEQMNYSPVYMLINCICIIGVNLFFLISGYCKIQLTIRKLLYYILSVYALFLPVQLMGFITGYIEITKTTLLQIANPFDYYWFLIVYLFLMLFSPFLNMVIDHITWKDFLLFGVLVLAVFCGYGFFADTNLLIRNGYSFLMASGLYIVGGGIKKQQDYLMKHYSEKHVLLTYMLVVLINYLCVVFMNHRNLHDLSWKLYSYNNPLVFIASITLFLVVLRWKSHWKIASIVGQSTLSIYIIHSTCWLTQIRRAGIQKLATGVIWIDVISLISYACVIVAIGCLYQTIQKRSLLKLAHKLSSLY